MGESEAWVTKCQEAIHAENVEGPSKYPKVSGRHGRRPHARWLGGGQAERLPGRHATQAETPLRASSPPCASCLRGARLSDFPAHLRACARSRLRLAPAWPRAAGVGWIVVCVTPGLVPRVGRDVPVPVTCVSDERREGSRPLSPPAALRRHCSRPPEGHQLSYQHKQHGVTPASGWVSTHICP